MSKTPIDIMMDAVKWELVPKNESIPDETLHATHEGRLEFLGISLKCYRLNDGQAVFDADDVQRFFSEILS